METFFTRILNSLTKLSLYLAIFLTPIFFLPFTADILEVNKYFLFYFLIILALMTWLARAVSRKIFEFKRTPLDIPLAAMWLVFLVVSLVSEERYLSFFGEFSSLSLSFFGLTALLFFYFLIVQNLRNINQILLAVYLLMFSGALSALYLILPVFLRLGNWFFLPKTWPVYGLVNSSNTLSGVFLVVIFSLALAFLTIKKRSLALDVFYFLVLLLTGAAIVMIGFKIVWVAMVAAIFLMLIFFLTYMERVRTIWTSVAFGILVVSLLFIFFGTPKILTMPLPVEVSLSSSTSVGLILDALKDSARHFLFGSGPSTFIFDFSKYRALDFNSNFAWNIRFRQPYSSALDWLATTGLLGALSLLLVVLMVLGLIVSTWLKHFLELRRKKKIEESSAAVAPFQSSPLIFWTIVGAWLILLISFFFINFSLAHWLMFWLFLGLLVGAGAHLAKIEMPELSFSLKTSPQYAMASSFGFILIFTAIIVVGIFLGRYFTAEIVYARSLNKPLDGRIAGLQKAAEFNPNRVLFHLALAEAFLKKAVEETGKTNDLNQVASLVASAVQAAKLATDKAPNNVATWEYLSTMYANARSIAPEANNWTIGALEKAIALEPTNPLFYIAIGNAKLFERRYTEAKEDFEKAISLKPNLLDGYLRLATLKEAQNDINGAIVALERGLGYGAQDPVYLFQLGRYYFNRAQKGDYDLAEMAFRRAVDFNPNYSDALFALGLFYEKRGDNNQALEWYKKVLILNPGNKDIKKKIDNLSSSPEEKKK
ncbi:MAG: tetratricopeptide repeat protein [Patescibacteria group bacterium]